MVKCFSLLYNTAHVTQENNSLSQTTKRLHDKGSLNTADTGGAAQTVLNIDIAQRIEAEGGPQRAWVCSEVSALLKRKLFLKINIKIKEVDPLNLARLFFFFINWH